MTKELKHFGVLGMRWGYRKSKNTGGGKKSRSEKYQERKAAKLAKEKTVKRIIKAVYLAYAAKYAFKISKAILKAYLLSPEFKAKYKKAKTAYDAYKSIKLPANVDQIIKPLIIEGKFK